MSEPLDLEPIKAREKAATPGPWTNPWTNDKDHADAFYAPKTDSPANAIQPNAVVCSHPWDGGRLMVREHDAAFIAASRSDVPALVAEVERLRAENQALRREAFFSDRDEILAELRSYGVNTAKWERA